MLSRWAIARNLTVCWLLLLAPSLLVGWAGWALGGQHLALIFGVTVAFVLSAAYWYADRIAMGMAGARELLLTEAPALHTVTSELATRARVPAPKLYLLPTAAPRSLSAGRSGARGSALAVSTGLLAGASPAELEGIVAHELAHVRRHDLIVQTAATVLAGWLVESSRIAGKGQRAVLTVFAPIAASMVHLLLSEKREYAADLFAAQLCESPHGLADALLRLDQTRELLSFEASPPTEPLHTVNPLPPEGWATLFNTHPPVGERVRRLRELDPDWREKLQQASAVG